jgi:hypothetical protein
VLTHPPGTAQRMPARPAVDLTTGVVPQWRRTSGTADTEVTAAQDCSGVLLKDPGPSPTPRPSRRTNTSTSTDPTSQEPA